MNSEVTTSTERVNRHRERRRRGVLAVVPVEVTDDLVRELIKEGWLGFSVGNVEVTPGVVASAISEAISEMLDTWAHE